MKSSTLPDWSKIGRRIGKRLRDILLPPQDPGPTPEERNAQRLRDVHKGFAYFDTFEELFSWSPSDVDPVQQANTPLLPRYASSVHDCSKPSARLLLCHDYKGGYHDYETVRPGPISEEFYSCEYLQYVELFIYFSHKLICCPPPPWINLLHRNGVKILGTFIVEPQTPGIERMLECHEGDFIVATQLADMSNMFGFDGWLLNIENEFPGWVRPREKLTSFITALKRRLGPGKSVIWYDALTAENEVDYQNALTSRNAEFASHADALFTNYKWTMGRISESRTLATEQGIFCSKIHFGIDVWAQNTDMPGPRRTTYPKNGGGGTNTGLATNILAGEGFSAAMFAPAWAFEHFPTSPSQEVSYQQQRESIAKAVDRSMWEGYSLPPNLSCDCSQGRPHHTKYYQETPIVSGATEYPAGSSTYLQTDFSRAFKQDKNRIKSCLGSQAILPHLLSMSAQAWEAAKQNGARQVLYGQYEHGGVSIRLGTAGLSGKFQDGDLMAASTIDSSNLTTSRLCLFKVSMVGDGSLQASITYQMVTTRISCAVGIYTAYKNAHMEELEYRHHHISSARGSDAAGAGERKLKQTEVIQLQAEGADAHLVEIGIFCQSMDYGPRSYSVLHLTSLIIKPQSAKNLGFTIDDLRMVKRGKAPYIETRLAWTCGADHTVWPVELPWSATTGPFSRFTIMLDEENIGSAYCLEFPARQEDCRETDQVQAWIVGHLFDGETVKSVKMTLLRRNLSPPAEDETWSLLPDSS